MRRLGAWGLSIALVFGAAPAWAGPAEGAPGDASSAPAAGNWLSHWLSPGSKAPAKKPDPAAEKDPQGKTAPPDKPAVPVADVAAQRAREEAKYLRRMIVCDRLRDIADQTNDPALQRRADELLARAAEVYRQRTANCPANQAVFESDQKTLDKHLGTADAAPARSGPGLITVPTKEGRSTALEEKR